MTVSTRRITAELVVHLQPVGLHAVLDPGAEPAVVFVVGVHFAIEAAIPLAAEKAEDVLGGKGPHRIIQERAVQAGQRRATLEQQVGGVLGLIDDPMHGVAREQFAQQRIDLPCPTIEDFRPVELGEAVGQALGLDRVVELGERVVLLHEAQLLLHHLLGQPFVAIDVDLDGERQPGLQANVDQAELGIEEVVIEDPLLPRSADELRPLGTGMSAKEGQVSWVQRMPTSPSEMPWSRMRFWAHSSLRNWPVRYT